MATKTEPARIKPETRALALLDDLDHVLSRLDAEVAALKEGIPHLRRRLDRTCHQETLDRHNNLLVPVYSPAEDELGSLRYTCARAYAALEALVSLRKPGDRVV